MCVGVGVGVRVCVVCVRVRCARAQAKHAVRCCSIRHALPLPGPPPLNTPPPTPRVYVIDGDEKPVGCATCTDVLRAVLAATMLA